VPDLRRLIVNADDLGYDPEIDRGILEAHARGIVTSATAMVDGVFTAAALRACPPTLGLGVHVVLSPQVGPDGVAAEVRRQVERFVALAGRFPTHLDSHRHVHASAALAIPFARTAAALGLPVRAIDAGLRAAVRGAGAHTTDEFLGDAALRPCWTRERLMAALASVGEGTTELMCHPGYAPAVTATSFGREREVELAALCDPSAREALRAAGVTLIDWGSVGVL
jgi:chitin disaccharide deacetylase